MRRFELALAASTLALGITSGVLWRRLCSERQRADAESSERARRELEIDVLERTQADLERELRRQRREAASASTERELSAQSTRPAAAPPVSVHGAPSLAGIPTGLRRMGVLRTYGELARELNLSPSQTNALMDLLVAQDEASAEDARELPLDPTTLRQQLELMERKKEAAIADQLGPDAAGRYRAYRDSLHERMELRMIRDHLDTLGTPINPAQREKLLAILIEEQRPPADGMRAPHSALDAEQLQAVRADVQRRIQERAGAVLDTEQSARLNEYYAMQNPSMAVAGASRTR